jgi:hypothetical protein
MGLQENPQLSLFDVDPKWREEWVGMPEFVQENNEPFQKISVSFAKYEDVQRFGALLGLRVTPQTDAIWFPQSSGKPVTGFLYVDES